MSDSKYSVLFDEVKIGPVVARNRFYQVPHCTGMGHLRPQAESAIREMKAEGGWAVVSTQESEIHPSSDLSPYAEGRIWDQHDLAALQLITDKVHDKGALAAIQLVHNGSHAANALTRAVAFAPSDTSVSGVQPRQARAMSKADIREFRRWHRQAVRRAVNVGFDIIYVYAGHEMTLAQHFLLPRYNVRSDEYGGSLENRARLLQELICDAQDEVGGKCAVAVRFGIDEMLGTDGMQAEDEGRAVVEMLADLPDLWDVNVSGWENDSVSSRFEPHEGYQMEYVKFVKQVTSKPVVAVGRLLSADMMVKMVNRGVVDFIGAARPSIADPFLPQKIRAGQLDEICECIGCNICVASDNLGIPIRCTQNPTMGEEWRRGWHPQKIAPKGAEEDVLVVGGGVAGLECAMQLGRRGYHVVLAEADGDLGGRVRYESKLARLSAWQRVVDYREYDLRRRENVEIFTHSEMSADAVVELGIRNVFIATGAQWRRDGVGRSNRRTVDIPRRMNVLTADDIFAGRMPSGDRVLIYDDEQIYLAGALAEHLATEYTEAEVIFATPATMVSPWTTHTLEQERVQCSLLAHGVDIKTGMKLTRVLDASCVLGCIYSNSEVEVACTDVLLVTERLRRDELYTELQIRQQNGRSSLNTLELMGDASAPGLIADAVYHGHLVARNFEKSAAEITEQLYKREMIGIR